MQPLDREKKALERFTAVSTVINHINGGMSLRQAIAKVTKGQLFTFDDRPLSSSTRTLYRWYKRYEQKKLAGLMRKERPCRQGSLALSPRFISFLIKEKHDDPNASIPDIIRRAEVDGIVKNGTLSRVTVWRAARRLNLPIFADKMSSHDDVRRFEHRCRLRMVLCDGKHFRAGATRMKRLVFFFLDDATRKVLGAVVGLSEDKALFLRGLMRVIRDVGLIDGLYLDRGPAFIAKYSATICARIDIPLKREMTSFQSGLSWKVKRVHSEPMTRLARTQQRPQKK